MATTPLHIEYESLGDPLRPAIMLIMGLGMQLTGWPDDFCRGLVARGYRVVRFDNRDCGLSGRAPGKKRANLLLAMAAAALRLPVRTPYTLEDMAGDAVGLMDRLGIERAHIVGVSMGGMIAQVLAALWPQRVLSLTSIMSSSGNRRVSRPSKQAGKVLLSRPADPKDPESVIEYLVKMFGVIGSPGYPSTPEELRRRVGPSVRRDTAQQIPGAALLVIDGMGHDLPDPLLPRLVQAIADHCDRSAAAASAAA